MKKVLSIFSIYISVLGFAQQVPILLWEQTLANYVTAGGCIKTADGNYLFLVSTYGNGIGPSFAIKVDKNGTVLWENTEIPFSHRGASGGGHYISGGNIIVQKTDGSIWGIGRCGNQDCAEDTNVIVRLVQLDNDTGETIQVLDLPSESFDSFHSYNIVPTRDNGLLISGFVDTTGFFYPRAIKLNAEGIVEWDTTITEYQDIFSNALSTSDGSYLFVGGYITLLSENGTFIWHYEHLESTIATRAELQNGHFVAVAKVSLNAPFRQEVRVIVTDRNGNLIAQYPITNEEEIYEGEVNDIIEEEEGTIFIALKGFSKCNHTSVPQSVGSIRFIKMYAESGEILFDVCALPNRSNIGVGKIIPSGDDGYITVGQIIDNTGQRKAWMGKFGYNAMSTPHFTENMVNIYPNPAKNTLTVENNFAQSKTVTVTNTIGQTVAKETINSVENTINISALANGIYFLRVENGAVYKWIKE